MDDKTTAINQDHSQPVIHIYSTSYDLFILVLTVFALLVAGALLLPLNPSVEAILLWVDFLFCMLFLGDFGLDSGAHLIGHSIFSRKEAGWTCWEVFRSCPGYPGRRSCAWPALTVWSESCDV